MFCTHVFLFRRVLLLDKSRLLLQNIKKKRRFLLSVAWRLGGDRCKLRFPVSLASRSVHGLDSVLPKRTRPGKPRFHVLSPTAKPLSPASSLKGRRDWNIAIVFLAFDKAHNKFDI